MESAMRPKLRQVQVSHGQQYGQPVVVLNDPLGLSEHAVALPMSIAPLLELCDGTRDIATLSVAFELRTGVRVGPEYLRKLISTLDEALLLDSEHFVSKHTEAVNEFRCAPSRSPVMMGTVYQENPKWMEHTLKEYFDALPPEEEKTSEIGQIRGIVSPHIDYQRGGAIYAGVWRRAVEAVRAAEVVIILGTNHLGGKNLITMTRQSYSTPWGILTTAGDVVDAIVAVLGEDEVFAEEINHRNEHSVEAAAVWLHYLVKDRGCALVPILCGSFHGFIEGEENPCEDAGISRFVEAVNKATADRHSLIVAAGDLAHVGPAFGDRTLIHDSEKSELSTADSELMAAIAAGDAEGMFLQVKQAGDRRRICGLSPIYLALRLLGNSRGEVTGYAQCPADHQGTSLVSICGMVLG